MPLSPDDRRAIAGRAATVFDRAAAEGEAPADSAAGAGDGQALAALGRWRQAFAPGDPAAFERRLVWDDLGDGRALRAIAAPGDPAAFEACHWTTWLDSILDEVPAVAADLAGGRWPGPAVEAAHPFDELRTPIRRAARRELTAVLRAEAARRADGHSPFDLVEPCIFGYLERQLDREIARTAELAWFDRFQATPAEAREGDGTAAYRAFVLSLLGDLPGFFRDYARLAHQIATIVSAWVDASGEMLVRLRADRQAIGVAFAGGADPGLLVHIDTALSDPHHGRRRVAVLWFESGLRVVYKPRGIGVEAAFGRLLAWLNDGLDAPLRTLRTLDRDTHGWVEHAAPAPAFGLEDAVRYFRRAGALMCVTSVLGARDLHRDNLVAAAGGPVLVDLELLLQPDRLTAGPAGTGDAAPASCLSTGMLSLIDIGPDGQPHDAGGLRGETTGTLPLPTRVWFGSGTNALRFDHISTFHTSRSHELVVDGKVQRPEEFSEAVTAGFADAYRYLVDHRDELLAEDGPLDALGQCRVRVLPRLTNQYAMMAALLVSPACQHDGVTAGCAIDVLHRPFSRSMERPVLWPMVLEERRALLALDIPHFTVRADGIRASGGSRALDVDFFTISGLAGARRRIASLSVAALGKDVAVLERALSESVRSTFSNPPPGPRPAGADTFVDDAQWIARELQDRAVSTRDGLLWRYRRPVGGPGWRDHHLYDGSVGTALFFQALAHVTGDRHWADVATRALDVIRRHVDRHPIESAPDDEQIGAGNGLASVAYGLALAVSMGADPALVDVVRDLAHGVVVRLSARSPRDVVNGSAGAALVFVALYEALKDDTFSAAADACAGHVLDTAVPVGSGELAWPEADEATLVGLAHGAAGMALALARVSTIHADRRYARAARRAFTFVGRQYLPALSNWPVAVGSDDVAQQGAMNGWCHGAPGITLAALTAGEGSSGGTLPGDLDPLFHAMAVWQPAQTDHVCCGNLARVESLLVAGRVLGRDDVVEAARAAVTRTVDRARRRGHFRLSGAGTDYRVFDPGFFQGLAGVGYQLLRAARPLELPSVAAFDAPRASLRYCSTEADTDRDVARGLLEGDPSLLRPLGYGGQAGSPSMSSLKAGPPLGRKTLGA